MASAKSKLNSMRLNLVKAAFEVYGYNRSRPGLDRLSQGGGKEVGSIAKAARGADAVTTVLPESPE
jgi:2-hydroxy-3-oxopropionate reductase